MKLLNILLFLSFAIFISCSKKEGCTYDTACNFEPSNVSDDGSCYYCFNNDCENYSIEFYDCDGACITDSDNNGICDELEVNVKVVVYSSIFDNPIQIINININDEPIIHKTECGSGHSTLDNEENCLNLTQFGTHRYFEFEKKLINGDKIEVDTYIFANLDPCYRLGAEIYEEDNRVNFYEIYNGGSECYFMDIAEIEWTINI